MSKLQMGYDVSTGEIIRTHNFTERTKRPDPVLSRSARRRLRKRERKQLQSPQNPQNPHNPPHNYTQQPQQPVPSFSLIPSPLNWGWSGMHEYLLLIKYWVGQLSLGGDNNIIASRVEAAIVAYLTLLFSMKLARQDQSDSVWVDKLEDFLDANSVTRPFVSHIITYRNGWSEPTTKL